MEQRRVGYGKLKERFLVPRIRSDSFAALVEWDDLPHWQRDNEYILSGYRPASYSFQKSFQSVVAVHNETINIHSHSLGAILFLTLPYITHKYFNYSRLTMIDTADIIVFSTFIFGVATCFLLSSTFHTFANHSPRINILGNQLDYLGIVILMWGSTIPSVYYGFYCDPHLQKQYWMIVTALAMACIVTTFNARFRSPALRPYRALMYTALGFSALGFVTHGLVLYGWETQKWRMSLDWMGLMTVLNLTGALAYAARVPEKSNPRRFDILGNSHQILHVMVILAALAHMCGLFLAFEHVHDSAFICGI